MRSVRQTTTLFTLPSTSPLLKLTGLFSNWASKNGSLGEGSLDARSSWSLCTASGDRMARSPHHNCPEQEKIIWRGQKVQGVNPLLRSQCRLSRLRCLDNLPGQADPRAMPRQVRIEYPGAMYHVMSRGNRRQDIYPKSPHKIGKKRNLFECRCYPFTHF